MFVYCLTLNYRKYNYMRDQLRRGMFNLIKHSLDLITKDTEYCIRI